MVKRTSEFYAHTTLEQTQALDRTGLDSRTAASWNTFGLPLSARYLLTTQGKSLSQLTIHPPFETRSERGVERNLGFADLA